MVTCHRLGSQDDGAGTADQMTFEDQVEQWIWGLNKLNRGTRHMAKTKAARAAATKKAAAKLNKKPSFQKLPTTPVKPKMALVKGNKTAKVKPERESKAVPMADFELLVDSEFADKCARYRQLTDQEAQIKIDKDELKEYIEPMLEMTAPSIDGGDWVAVRAKGKSVSISKERLLACGVPMATIKKCTVEKDYYYIQVRKP